MYLEVAPGTTWCPDTPANRREFELLKALLARGSGRPRFKAQVSKENKWLRGLRAYLPGHEPDR